MCASAEQPGNIALPLTPISARRRQWAADIDFRISLSPEIVDVSLDRCEDVLPTRVVKKSSDCSADLSTGAELSPARSSISGEATWPPSASDCEPISPDLLAPPPPRIINSMVDDSAEHVDHESCFGQRLGIVGQCASTVECKDGSQCLHDEFSFTAEPGSVASVPSLSYANTSCASTVGLTSRLSFASAHTSFEQKGTDSHHEKNKADVSSSSILPNSADSQHEKSNADVSTSSDVDDRSIDTATTLESSKTSGIRQLRALQRTPCVGHSVGHSTERSSATPRSIAVERKSSRPATPSAFSKLQTATDSTVKVEVQALSFSERSKVWAEQREQRLQRLRDMQLQLLRSGTSKSSSSSRREGSPMRNNASSAASSQTLYARDQAWLERKHLKEKELREAAFHDEVRECTFRPNASDAPQSRTAVTPDRARQLFDRHVSWKLRLDENSERQRREKREASEQNIKELRRSASADAALRLSSCRPKSPGSRASLDVEGVFNDLIERNQRWKRARDARIEQLQESAVAQQLQAAVQVHSSRAKASRSDEIMNTPALTCQTASVEIQSQKCETKPCESEASPMSRQLSMNSIPGQPVRAPRTSPSLHTGIAESSEHVEVMSHLHSLRKCLRSSQSCNTGTWQRTIRVAAARLGGAGAAPLRAASLHNLPPTQTRITPRGSCTSEGVMRTARSRTRSPASGRCSPQPSQQHYLKQGARSRDPSPHDSTKRRHSYTPRSPHATPRNSFGAYDSECRQRRANSPAPPRPRPSSVGPRMTTS